MCLHARTSYCGEGIVRLLNRAGLPPPTRQAQPGVSFFHLYWRTTRCACWQGLLIGASRDRESRNRVCWQRRSPRRREESSGLASRQITTLGQGCCYYRSSVGRCPSTARLRPLLPFSGFHLLSDELSAILLSSLAKLPSSVARGQPFGQPHLPAPSLARFLRPPLQL